MRGVVILVVGLTRAEPKIVTAADLGKRLERVHEFGHDAENAPRILANNEVVSLMVAA